MNRDDIIRMAREAGMAGMLTDVVTTFDELERFAALVAAAERETCAEACKRLLYDGEDSYVVNKCVEAICARGKK